MVAMPLQSEREFQVKADIPGVSKDSVKVMQDGDVLSISAEAKHVRITQCKRALVRELSGTVCGSAVVSKYANASKLI